MVCTSILMVATGKLMVVTYMLMLSTGIVIVFCQWGHSRQHGMFPSFSTVKVIIWDNIAAYSMQAFPWIMYTKLLNLCKNL